MADSADVEKSEPENADLVAEGTDSFGVEGTDAQESITEEIVEKNNAEVEDALVSTEKEEGNEEEQLVEAKLPEESDEIENEILENPEMEDDYCEYGEKISYSSLAEEKEEEDEFSAPYESSRDSDVREETYGEYAEEEYYPEYLNLPEDYYYMAEGEEEYTYVEKVEEENVKEEEESSSASTLSNIYSKLSPFFIEWSFGVSKVSKIINLTKNEQFEVFYSSSHFGVIYDYRRNAMKFLPGHNSNIKSISADASGRWLVTSDDGDDSAIIVWDHDRNLPCWSLYNIFSGKGPKCVQISQDARFLAALSSDGIPRCKFYLWTFGREQADGEIDLEETAGDAVHVAFNHLDTTQFAVTLEWKVIFVEWVSDKSVLEKHAAAVRMRKGKIGVFRETLFLDDNHTAITSSSTGYVSVWCDNISKEEEKTEDAPGSIKKNYVKTVRIHKSGITSLQLVDNAILSSSEDGVISFHDQSISLLYWVPRYVFESVVSVSCNLLPQRPEQLDPFCDGFDSLPPSNASNSEEEVANFLETEEEGFRESGSDDEQHSKALNFVEEIKKKRMIVPSDYTIERKPFYIRDFIYLTSKGKFGYVSHHRTKVKHFLYPFEAPILSIDCHPHSPHFVIGNSVGRVDLYQQKHKKLLVSEVIAKEGISALKYSPKGRYLFAGLKNGTILILDPILLTVKTKIKIGSSEIIKICFTSNEKLFAYFDTENAVYLHKLSKMESKLLSKKWQFMGGYRSHFKPIRDLMFDEEYESRGTTNLPRLFSIGEDRMLVEYDLTNMLPRDLKLKSIDRIEQTAIPQCFTICPRFGSNISYLISNNEYKLKVMDRKTRICTKTTLGPTADSPITFMKVITDSKAEDKTAKMIYATERHIGLLLLPHTGNPFEGMGMIGHPVKIKAIAISNDFNYLYTVGLNDTSILMWKINAKSIDIGFQLGGSGIEPFMSLVEGGSEGFLFKEIQDFFYYSQIIHQGENANLNRSVSKTLPLCELPDLFRSLGYYPTDYEIENMLYEASHQNFEETGTLTKEILFDDCVKLYLNHRPLNGITLESINKALLSIADIRDPTCVLVEKEELYKALEERAEAMSHEEVVGYLCILLLSKDEKDPLPPTMTLKDFADDVLGIDLNITEEYVREITHPFEKQAEN